MKTFFLYTYIKYIILDLRSVLGNKQKNKHIAGPPQIINMENITI